MKPNTTTFTLVTAAMSVWCLTLLWTTLALSQTANRNNITGQWQVVANTTRVNTGPELLKMSQGANGILSGSIFGNQIEGLYVPATRRIVFVRKGSNGMPFQLFEGNVSSNGLRIGGTMVVWNGAGGGGQGGVDFNFFATKQSDTP